MDEKQSHGSFIQFPLQLLATDWTLRKIMGHSMGWSAHLLVKKWQEKENSLHTEQMTEDLYERAAGTVGFGCLGGKKFAPSCLSDVKQIEETLKQLLRNQEPSKIFVRLPTAYAHEIQNGQWKEPEARVYLAVACIIGVQKPYALAGWPLIARRAAGIAYAGQKSATKLMTRKKVDYQLNRLCDRDLFACYCFNRGARYWSFPNKCTREAIARSVLQRHIARKQRTAESDAALTARIMAESPKPKK